MVRRSAILVLACASFGAVPAHARTLAVVPRVSLRVRPPSRLAPGSPGTLDHAIAEQDKRRRWKRLQSEGTVPERDPDGTCPPEMAVVDARFCADRWEGSLVEIGEEGSERREHPWSPWLALDATKHYRAVSTPGVIPQGYISGEQAEAACRGAGKRLCSASEWRLACAEDDD